MSSLASQPYSPPIKGQDSYTPAILSPTLTVVASHLGDQAQTPQALWTLQTLTTFTYPTLSLSSSVPHLLFIAIFKNIYLGCARS